MEKVIDIVHHGAVRGVTGSCHKLIWGGGARSVLVDCGLFQGAEASPGGAHFNKLDIDFDLNPVRALIVTHCHIDHVGRIPYLLEAGFRGPIYCSEPSAILLPLVLEDAVKVGFTRNRGLVRKILKHLKRQLVPVPYGHWQEVDQIRVCFRPAGHILGSAYVECRVPDGKGEISVLFSGDLGAPHAPLLPTPQPPHGTDVLVIESTYGDRDHEGRKTRRDRLRTIVERCFENKGTVIIPAFSIGRTQELIYELEDIIHRFGKTLAGERLRWEDVDVIVDSPLANKFTEVYKRLKPFWDKEAKAAVAAGRHPLSFEQLTTVNDHREHLRTVEYLRHSGRPAIVIAASGMCSGGRVVNYLKALISDPKTDVLFVGYQARGTAGRAIRKYGPSNGWVYLDGKRYTIQAQVHTINGYSAHAGRSDLIRFVRRMRRKPRQIRVVHGDPEAKASLKEALAEVAPEAEILVPNR